MIKYDWFPMLGNFELQDDIIIFYGRENVGNDGRTYAQIGHLIFNKYFSEGIIKAEIEFEEIDNDTGCDILFYNNITENGSDMASVGIDKTPVSMFELKSFRNGKWDFYKFAGDVSTLKKQQKYILEMEYKGNTINLKVNGIKILQGNIPFFTTNSQVGIWARSRGKIKIHNYEVEDIKPKAFVIMQFTEQFNELYNDVIKPICESYNLDVVRADDIYNNGMIIHDIIDNITESKIIVADISPRNANVYYEVGYAHALEKPTILLAEEGTELPFDIKPYRVIFYKNSISGKRQVEENLEKHLGQIL